MTHPPEPLAVRVRPTTFDEVIGQDRVIAMNASGDARQALTLLEALDTARGDKPATLDMLTSLAPHAIQLDGSGIGHEQIIAKRLQAIDNLINATDGAL